MRVIGSCLAIVAEDCQSRGLTDVCQVIGDVYIGCVSKTCGVLIVIVILGNLLDIGLYLCLVSDNLNVTNLAVAVATVHHKKAVLEHRTCLYCETRVVREVGGAVIYLQEHII